jgi:hypothetical protein
MTAPVKHALIILSTAVATLGCADNDPCEDTPNSIFCQAGGSETGETGEPDPEGCVPNIEEGYAYECQGSGNGWLQLSVFGEQEARISCANYGDEGAPGTPQETDCVPFDLGVLPSDIPSPEACCTDDAASSDVVAQCEDDCGWAACKIAVAKMREAANSLSSGPLPLGEANARQDLFYLANMLEMPSNMDSCASLVRNGAGELVAVPLGAGITSDNVFGHVINSTLYLQCSIDAITPYVATTNIGIPPKKWTQVTYAASLASIACCASKSFGLT